MNDLPGRHDMDTSGIHRPNPYEQDGPDEPEVLVVSVVFEGRYSYAAVAPVKVGDRIKCGDHMGTVVGISGRVGLPMCPTCGEETVPREGQRCARCTRNIEEDRMNREQGL